MKRKRRWDVKPSSSADSGGIPEEETENDGDEEADTKAPSSKKRRIDSEASTEIEQAVITDENLWLREMRARNGPITDEMLDEIFPAQGYVILEPPDNYDSGEDGFSRIVKEEGFAMPDASEMGRTDLLGGVDTSLDDDELPALKPEDLPYFGKLLERRSPEDEEEETKQELREKHVLKCLLKIKNGTPMQRKSAYRSILKLQNALDDIFTHLIPLLMCPTFDPLERHYFLKLLDKLLYVHEERVAQYTQKILVIVEPLLLEDDPFTRIEGREIISNLAKAVGFAHMIFVMRFDLSSDDVWVRTATARTFAIVGSALGIPVLSQFLQAIFQSKKSWEAQHTGIMILKELAILLQSGVLPHLKTFLNFVQPFLESPQQLLVTESCSALTQFAKASAPYGIEYFEPLLIPIFFKVNKSRGKLFTSFLNVFAALFPLMTDTLREHYATHFLPTLKRNFHTQHDGTRVAVLSVLKQVLESLSSQQEQRELWDRFQAHFWMSEMSLNHKVRRRVVECTVTFSRMPSVEELVPNKLCSLMTQRSSLFRGMVLNALASIRLPRFRTEAEQVRLSERVLDGVVFCLTQLTAATPFRDRRRELRWLATLVNKFELLSREKDIARFFGMIKHRLMAPSHLMRQDASDLLWMVLEHKDFRGPAGLNGSSQVALKNTLLHFCTVFEEKLPSEEYPDTIGSQIKVLRLLHQTVNVPHEKISGLLLQLVPFLKNRHAMVQQNTIDFVGSLAETHAESIGAKDWLRISFDCLELMKSPRKTVRNSACNTFGFIAKAIGPQEVVSTLLANLRVQERQIRVCTTIAIAVVGDMCEPFTVLPAMMNEYKVPDGNVQNGVLKALSFLIQYIGADAKDYLDSITPLLHHALTERDAVHRQLACNCVMHLALHVPGRRETFMHFLNLVWPNILLNKDINFTDAIISCMQALSYRLGPEVIAKYAQTGLYHPSRLVRNVFWKVWNNAYILNPEAVASCKPEDKLFHDDYELMIL